MAFTFGVDSLYSPQDDIQTRLLDEVSKAEKSIYMMIYGFHLPSLTDLLIQKHKEGVLVQCVLDFSQSKGTAEKVEVQRLIDVGVDVVVGTSPMAHQIMHEKLLIIDMVKTISGSYNFSLSAEKQVNHCDIFYSPDRAMWALGAFNYVRSWMVTNEPDKQLEKITSL